MKLNRPLILFILYTLAAMLLLLSALISGITVPDSSYVGTDVLFGLLFVWLAVRQFLRFRRERQFFAAQMAELQAQQTEAAADPAALTEETAPTAEAPAAPEETAQPAEAAIAAFPSVSTRNEAAPSDDEDDDDDDAPIPDNLIQFPLPTAVDDGVQL